MLILLVLNIGAGYFLFYSTKIKADGLTSSAKNAAGRVTSQNASLFGLDTSDLPKTDVTGNDPAGITRYQKAMRSAYTKSDNGTETAEYKVLAPVNVVLVYYRTQLAKNNWILNSASDSAILFTKDAQQISISGTNVSGVTTYTMILK